MLTEYIPPTKWWRREVALYIKIPLWPDWLARRLCDHSASAPWIEQFPDCALMCPDCGAMVNLKSYSIGADAPQKEKP